MFKHQQLRAAIIQPALQSVGLYSLVAEELLVATCAIESYGGTYLVQTGSGPAQGIFQMEPATHDDLWRQLRKNHRSLAERTLYSCGYASQPKADTLTANLWYASIMARLLYFVRIPHALPADSAVDTLWTYYKQHWNTILGKARKERFLSAYYHFIGGHCST